MSWLLSSSCGVVLMLSVLCKIIVAALWLWCFVRSILTLIGGGPQVTLLGGLEYLSQSNNNTDILLPKDKFKYLDDLSILELICFSGLLMENNFKQHVASDVGIDQLYLPADKFKTQDNLNFISQWTDKNLMKLNEV